MSAADIRSHDPFGFAPNRLLRIRQRDRALEKTDVDSLIDLFAECLDVEASKLSEDSSPGNIDQWDSLRAMLLVSAIEERYGITLSTREIMSMQTIGIARSVLIRKGVSIT